MLRFSSNRYIFLGILFICFLLGCSNANKVFAQEEISLRTFSKITSEFIRKLDFSFDTKEFNDQLKQSLNNNAQFSEVVVKVARDQGLFLNAFFIPKEEREKFLNTYSKPFIGFLRQYGWSVIGKRKGPETRWITVATDSKLENEIYDKTQIISRWDGRVFSLPFTGIIARRINAGSRKGEGKLLFIYSYHKGEDFSKLKPVLEKLRKKAAEQNKKLIFLDELGLIPPDSVEGKQRRKGISRQEAFSSIRKTIIQENLGLSKGIPIHVGSKFYNDLYKYLAKHRVYSLIEKLDYELWKQIVKFDRNEIKQKSMVFYLAGDIKHYIESLAVFTKGFWLYNVYKRDKIFIRQIKDIIRDYPESIIFILRGLGHYGIEELVETDRFKIETLVFAEGDFSFNLIPSQLLQVKWLNDVEVTKREKERMLLSDFLHESLRKYLVDEFNLGLSKATRIASEVIEKLSYKDLKKAHGNIIEMLKNKKIAKKNIPEFFYHWLDSRALIPTDLEK